jgi:tetratricopeptide (TPR) repeat protein
MKARFQRWSAALLVMGAAGFLGAPGLRAQYDTPPPQAPPAQKEQKQAPVKINKQEEAAYKAIFEGRGGDVSKEIELCEDFVQKYPQSHYLSSVYAQLTTSYMNTGQEDKMFAAGEKVLELDPNNVDVLSLMAMAMPRRIRGNTPDAEQERAKVEGYARKVIELVPNLTKPDGIDDATFEQAKNNKLAMAHSGLGLVEFQRQKYDDARNDLMQAVQLASNPDPVDYYLLGNANVQASYYNDAVTAFEKCAETSPALAAQCKARAEAAKKDAATKLGR